ALHTSKAASMHWHPQPRHAATQAEPRPTQDALALVTSARSLRTNGLGALVRLGKLPNPCPRPSRAEASATGGAPGRTCKSASRSVGASANGFEAALSPKAAATPASGSRTPTASTAEAGTLRRRRTNAA